MANERKRFSFPPNQLVQIHEPGTYTLSRLDDGSTLVELIDDDNEHEGEKLSADEELISEVRCD